MKQKTETITVAVELEITYDPTRDGSRAEVIKRSVEEIPSDLCGACIYYGGYSIKRGRRYLMPNVKDHSADQ
jgi:tartrate dehydratase beta subunit/fumarate hydratase class I family protein